MFYVNGSGEMVVAEVSAQGEAFEVTNRRVLFDIGERGLDASANYASWDVDHDNQHFLMIQFGAGDGDTRSNEFVLVQNWIEVIRAHLGN